jgi:hypothetical protein
MMLKKQFFKNVGTDHIENYISFTNPPEFRSTQIIRTKMI